MFSTFSDMGARLAFQSKNALFDTDSSNSSDDDEQRTKRIAERALESAEESAKLDKQKAEVANEFQAGLASMSIPRKALSSCFGIENLKRMFDSSLLSDVVICFRDRKIHAHKTILSLASAYFESAFTGNFMEADTSQIERHEDNGDAVAGMLRYVYGYNPFEGRDGAADINYTLEIFAVAGKYQLDDLLQIPVREAKDKIKSDPHRFPATTICHLRGYSSPWRTTSVVQT